MYIRRNIDKTLLEWGEAKHFKPVLLRGVRQCGKTSAVRKLAESFDNYIELNLERDRSLHKLFDGDIDINLILTKLELKNSKRIQDDNTLIFIDEIQECPRAITALRYFYEERPGLHVIAAGSLLEFALNGSSRNTPKVDFPVGRVRSIYMYPFSFTEFLAGSGNDSLARYLADFQIGAQENIAHKELIDIYKTFLIVGGMPEAISEYIASGSILACQQIHRDIILNFLDDFNKYSPNVPSDIIRAVFDYAMHNVCSQTKASSAINGVSGYYFDECVNLLRCAGLLYPVKATSCETIPLRASEKETNKKLLVFDSGVYLTMCGLDTGSMLGAEIFDDLNKGDVVEMQTGLELIKARNPYAEPSLHYWYKSGANAEIDYVIASGSKLIPIEVKASNKGSMQSMYVFLNSHSNADYGLRVSLEDFTSYDNIRVCPVYAVGKAADCLVPCSVIR